MNQTSCVLGSVLRCTPLQKRDVIVHVFTREMGRIKVVTRQRGPHKALCSPFVEAEWHVQAGRGDLHRLVDVSAKNLRLELRDELRYLEAAGHLLRGIEASQWLWKPAEDLYTLWTRYLDAVPHFSDLDLLELSFDIKLLKHEGLLHLEAACCQCAAPIADNCLWAEGQIYCMRHAPAFEALLLSRQDLNLLLAASEARSMSALETLATSATLRSRIREQFLKEVNARKDADGGI